MSSATLKIASFLISIRVYFRITWKRMIMNAGPEQNADARNGVRGSMLPERRAASPL